MLKNKLKFIAIYDYFIF